MKQYQFVKDLGSGSFGSVIKVRPVSDPNQFFAIKKIKLTNLNEKERDCALNQIRLLASISSPNVISYHNAFYDELSNNLCIVMEFADGGDLANLISKKRQKGQKFHENFIWQIAYDILKALKVLHSNKIIHRDLKPGNIFFVGGVAKLGDLNISKVMEGNFASTQAGTPYYTSPQIWNGQLYDGKCDIWSLGCLLYEISALRPPFMANDFPSLNKKISNGFYDPIPAIYSKRLSEIIKACLRVRMYDRPSAVQLLEDSVFHFLQTNEQGSVNLLNTIKCPRVLKLIQQKLPKKIQKQQQLIIYNPQTPNHQIKKFISQEKYKFRQIRSPLKDKSQKQNIREKSRSKVSLKETQPRSKGIFHRVQPSVLYQRPRLNSPIEYRKMY